MQIVFRSKSFSIVTDNYILQFFFVHFFVSIENKNQIFFTFFLRFSLLRDLRRSVY
nr:MAG TPA: hypothetical protein [Caudoviricetes sp.]